MVSAADVLIKVDVIVRQAVDNPAVELQRMGQALIDIGKAFDTTGPEEARKILKAVAIMHGIRL